MKRKLSIPFLSRWCCTGCGKFERSTEMNFSVFINADGQNEYLCERCTLVNAYTLKITEKERGGASMGINLKTVMEEKSREELLEMIESKDCEIADLHAQRIDELNARDAELAELKADKRELVSIGLWAARRIQSTHKTNMYDWLDEATGEENERL